MDLIKAAERILGDVEAEVKEEVKEVKEEPKSLKEKLLGLYEERGRLRIELNGLEREIRELEDAVGVVGIGGLSTASVREIIETILDLHGPLHPHEIVRYVSKVRPDVGRTVVYQVIHRICRPLTAMRGMARLYILPKTRDRG